MARAIWRLCCTGRRVQPYNLLPKGTGVRFGAGNVCISGAVDALPKRYTNRICEGHEDSKRSWRPLNSKRSLPVLKWTSESEYFLSFKKNFADNIPNI